VRRPAAARPGRRAFVSGKKKQNTGKATAISDGAGRLLWLGAFRPGRMHDVTALRTEGIEDLLCRHPDVQAEVDAGYQGLARDFPGLVSAPPKKPGKNAAREETAGWEQRRHQQSSQRICVEHAIAGPADDLLPGEAEQKPTSAAAPDLAKPQVKGSLRPRSRFERAPYCLGAIRAPTL